MAYKSGNPYKPLRALVGAQEARRLCPLEDGEAAG